VSRRGTFRINCRMRDDDAFGALLRMDAINLVSRL